MNYKFTHFTKKYSEIAIVVILILLLALAAVLRFEEARSVSMEPDAEVTKTEAAAEDSKTGKTTAEEASTAAGEESSSSEAGEESSSLEAGELSKDAEAASDSGEKPDLLELYDPETRIKIMKVNGSEATVVMFSTTELEEDTYYDLYVIEKRDGVWERSAYIRTIQMPATKKFREGKYSYYSDAVTIGQLSDKTIYQLIPHNEKNNHSSVPFWTRLT